MRLYYLYKFTEGRAMQKEELIFIHMTLAQVKRFFEEAGISNGHFETYNQLNISPVHIHRSKADHKKAIFCLCKDISGILKRENIEEYSKFSKVQEFLAEVRTTVQ